MNPKYELVNKEIIDITSSPISFNKQTYEFVLRNSICGIPALWTNKPLVE